MKINLKVMAVVAFALTLCASQSAFAAGAWSQNQGEFYAKLYNTTLIGNKAYALDGELIDVPSYHLISLDYYAEVGLGKQWTLISAGRPVGSARFDEQRGNYLGPLSFGVRRGFSISGLQIGLEGTYGFQGISERNLAPQDAPYVFRPTVPTQRGQLELAIGKGVSWGWVTGSMGAKAFTNELISPAIIANVQVGWRIRPRLLLDVHMALNQHLGELEQLNVTGAGESNYLGLGLGLSYWVSDRVGLNLGADGVVFARSNAGTPALMVGVELR